MADTATPPEPPAPAPAPAATAASAARRPPLPTSLEHVPVYAVNLAHRTDRWDTLTAHMADRELPAPRRWDAIHGPTAFTRADLGDYTRGQPVGDRTLLCCYGHNRTFTALMLHIARNHTGWVLAVEDDARFHPDIHTRYRDFAAAVPADADMAMLGGHHKKRPAPAAPGVGRVRRMNVSTAFMVTPATAERLAAANTPPRTSFDVAWHAVIDDGRTYCPTRHLAVQAPGYSDIAGHRKRPARGQYGADTTPETRW